MSENGQAQRPGCFPESHPLLSNLDTVSDASLYWRYSMMKWLTTLALILAVAASTAVGVHADRHEGSCPMANMPDCCEKAHSASNAPEISMARLCCNLNCSEPGSGAANNSANFSHQQGTMPSPAIIPSCAPFTVQFPDRYSSNSPHDSNPKYIQHLALLI